MNDPTWQAYKLTQLALAQDQLDMMAADTLSVFGGWSEVRGLPARTRCSYCGVDRQPADSCPGCGAPLP